MLIGEIMKIKTLLYLLVFASFVSCDEDVYIPKPIGYSRIDFPEHEYQVFNENCPFTFEYGVISDYRSVKDGAVSDCWYNIVYSAQKAKIHFSYLPVENNLETFIGDARTLAIKHLSKADDFEENVIIDEEAKVYGVVYDFKGSTASNLQFYLTDSLNHFVRGALYFEVVPKADSLAPSEKYIEEEVMHLIKTFTWK